MGEAICAPLRKVKEMISRQHGLLSPAWQRLLLSALLLAAGCSQSSSPAPETLSAGEWLTFEGTWTATGTRRTLRLGLEETVRWYVNNEPWWQAIVSGEYRSWYLRQYTAVKA